MTKIPLEKIKNTIYQNPKPMIAIAGLVMVASLYLFSTSEERKVVVYRQDKTANFDGGRVIGATDDVYQRKNQVLKGRLKGIEGQISKLVAAFKGHRLEIEERFQSLERSIGDRKENQNPDITPPPPAPTSPSPGTSAPRQSSYLAMGPQPIMVEPVVTHSTPKVPAKGPSTLSFPVESLSPKTMTTISLPAGSFVKAKNLTGVEAPEGKALPILMQLDYAFVGPNKTKIDLSGCFMIAKSTGNLSIERAEIQATKLSCVSRSGRSFEKKVNGFVADNKDNSFGVIGEVNSKQDNVAAMAFLSSIVEGVSGAIAQAQMTQSSNNMGGSTSILTGDQGKYLGASGASNAASTVTRWYLRHAQNLLPTINIGSGMDIWVVMQDGVDLPSWYFKAARNTEQQKYSFLSRFAD